MAFPSPMGQWRETLDAASCLEANSAEYLNTCSLTLILLEASPWLWEAPSRRCPLLYPRAVSRDIACLLSSETMLARLPY